MTRAIGLDIGERAVRALAITRSGQGWSIVGHALAMRRDAADEERPLAVVLGEIDAQLRLRGARLTVASRELTTMIRFVATAPMPRERLDKLLRLELAQHVEGGAELAADTFVVPIGGDEIIHCCVLAQPAQIYDLVRELAGVGASPTRVHHVGAAAFNATLAAAPVEGDDLALLVDIDAETTQVALIGEGRLIACRQVAIGGEAFTEALARVRGDALRTETSLLRRREAQHREDSDRIEPSADIAQMSTPSATSDGDLDLSFAGDDLFAPSGDGADGDVDEAFVIDIDRGELSPPAGSTISTSDAAMATPPPSPRLVADDDHDRPLGPELTRVAEQLYGQLASSLAWFRAQVKATTRLEPERILLAGPASDIPGLAGYLANRFGKPVELYDPMLGLTGHPPEDGQAWLGALGLAMSEAPNAIALDLLPDALALKREWRERLMWPYVAAALMLVACGLIAWAWLHREGVERATLARYQEYAAAYDQKAAKLAELQAEKDALGDDLRALAGRIYSGRDLLYTILALQQQTIQSKELWVSKLETRGGASDAAPATTTGGKPGGRRGSTARPTVKQVKGPTLNETTIDRGSINLTGFVKFDEKKSNTEMQAYVDKYAHAIERWTFPTGDEAAPVQVPLFDPAKTHWQGNEITRDEEEAQRGAKPGAKPASRTGDDKGEYSFTITFGFRPVDLAQVTTKAAPAPTGAREGAR